MSIYVHVMQKFKRSKRPYERGEPVSTIVTLYLTPVFYTYMDSFQTWLSADGTNESDRERLALSHEPLLAHMQSASNKARRDSSLRFRSFWSQSTMSMVVNLT